MRSSRNRWRGGKREQFRALMRELDELVDAKGEVLDEIADELPALRLALRRGTP